MPRATSEKVGRGVCPNHHCGEPVMYRRSSGGMLTHKCENCDSSGYAAPGGDAYRERMASIKTKVQPSAAVSAPGRVDPDPDPADTAPPASKPAKRASSVFDLSDL